METHAHHLHKAPGAGWKHYLFEFLMLFLAVFCGFLAENWREQVVERRRERELMVAFVNDLKLDTSQLSRLIQDRHRREEVLDSTILFYSEQHLPRVPLRAFRESFRLFGLSFFYQNTGTLDQLKNSGFRLIKHREIIDSIEKYDLEIRRMQKRDALEGELTARQRQLVEKLFNGRTLSKIYSDSILFSGQAEGPFIKRSSRTIDLNTQYIDEYLNLLINFRNLWRADTDVEVDLKDIAKNLIALIKNDYHLG
jgi:hypothetical protein